MYIVPGPDTTSVWMPGEMSYNDNKVVRRVPSEIFGMQIATVEGKVYLTGEE